MDIQDKVAIVTGAARGIGQATALTLAQKSAKAVVLVDLLASELEQTAALVTEAGSQAVISCTDVSNLESLREMFAAVDAQFGRIDILHNNAGIGEGHPDWPGITPERSAAIVDINLRGVILGTHLVLDYMKRNGGGVIVNTGSGGAFVPVPPQAVYVATKAAVVNFTKSCAPLAESHGVRVTCVCPGMTDTPMFNNTGDNDIAPWLKPATEVMRLFTPQEMADAVIDMISDDRKIAEVISFDNEKLTGEIHESRTLL